MKTLLNSIPANVYGIGLIFFGIMLRHWISYRRMRRTNKAGVSEFPTYGHKVISTFLEKWFRRFGLILIVFGLLVLAASWLNHNLN